MLYAQLSSEDNFFQAAYDGLRRTGRWLAHAVSFHTVLRIRSSVSTILGDKAPQHTGSVAVA